MSKLLIAALAVLMLSGAAEAACNPQSPYYDGCIAMQRGNAAIAAREAAAIQFVAPGPVEQPYADPRVETTPEGVTLMRGYMPRMRGMPNLRSEWRNDE